jgi:hypothetical protein
VILSRREPSPSPIRPSAECPETPSPSIRPRPARGRGRAASGVRVAGSREMIRNHSMERRFAHPQPPAVTGSPYPAADRTPRPASPHPARACGQSAEQCGSGVIPETLAHATVLRPELPDNRQHERPHAHTKLLNTAARGVPSRECLCPRFPVGRKESTTPLASYG